MHIQAAPRAQARWPGIERAALEIAYDNGAINRLEPRDQHLRRLRRWLDRQPQDVLPDIDAWLAALPDDRLFDVCCGEHDDAQAALDGAPPFTDDLLTRYFEEACCP